MNIKQEIQDCKSRIKKYQNQRRNCFNDDLKQHLDYQLRQEQLKLESIELLLVLSQKVGEHYQ